MKTKLLLLALLACSNLLWFGVYGRAARTLPNAEIYQIRKTDSGEARITCLNNGDATIRPVDEFGQIIVSCGQ